MREQLAALIRAERNGRDDPLTRSLRSIRDDYTRRGALGHGGFPVDLDHAAATELDLRVGRWLEIVMRAAALARAVWTEASASEIEALLVEELTHDWEVIQHKQRSFAAAQAISIAALNGALERGRTTVKAELQLRVIAQDRGAIPLLERLSVPRYAAPLRAWEGARSGFPREGEDPAAAARDAAGAVEELARIVLGETQITLGEAIRRLRAKAQLPSPALKGLEELWTLRSNTPGVGHGAAPTPLEVATARYFLDLAEAALRLLLHLDAG